MNYSYSFPATRGIQANKEFFTIICPLGLLEKIFSFYNDEIPEEFRAQRTLNEKRIPEIKDYIIHNPSSYIFSSITASIDGEYEFAPASSGNKNIGTLSVSMDANLLINDGQHRKSAIAEALKEKPELKTEHISVVLFIDQGLEKSQQMFSDLNKHAVKVSKSLGLLYNHRDPKIRFMVEYIQSNTGYNNFIDKSHGSLAQKSNKMFTLANFITAMENSFGKEDLMSNKELQKFVLSYWDYLSQNFSEWRFVFNKEISPYNARQNSVAVYGVVLEALGKLGYYIYSNNIASWRSTIKKLNKIDWNKTNHKDWLNRCMLDTGKIHKSGTTVSRTYIHIKELIGLPLTQSEKEAEMLLRKD